MRRGDQKSECNFLKKVFVVTNTKSNVEKKKDLVVTGKGHARKTYNRPYTPPALKDKLDKNGKVIA